MQSQKNKKILILKLGGACNLNCKHCHCSQVNYEYNPKIINYIKENNFDRITFCGGEPTLYYDTIKQIVEQLPNTLEYKLVTNATKLNNDMVNFFNQHNFTIVASYDGENDSRDRHLIPNWKVFSRIKNKSIATLYSESNQDIIKLTNEVNRLLKHIGDTQANSMWLNFPHQTVVNENKESNRELAKLYCTIIGQRIECDFIKFKAGNKKGLNVLGMAFKKWVKLKTTRGVACCNENIHSLTIDGRFLLCPYGQEYVGDLTTNIDFDKVESYIPNRCKSCSLWNVCNNSCIANITDTECYIAKILHRHFMKLMTKYNITYEDLIQYY